jgi:hypothetical protein
MPRSTVRRGIAIFDTIIANPSSAAESRNRTGDQETRSRIPRLSSHSLLTF